LKNLEYLENYYLVLKKDRIKEWGRKKIDER
jgi:hypothetical protein